MPQGNARFGTLEGAAQGRIVRYVSDDGLLLEPNENKLVSLLLQVKKKQPVDSPRLEWYEDDFMARWAQTSVTTVANTTASNTLSVDDGTKFTAGDVWVIPNGVGSAVVPELVLVTSVAGNIVTVTRAFAGTTITTIAPGDALSRLGPAFAEGFSLPNTRYTKPTAKISYTQIFSHVFDLTNTAAATKMYANMNQGERKFQHMKLLKEMKISLNRSLLWSKASEDLTGSQALRTMMGLNSIVTTNRTDCSGTLTQTLFEAFARSAFRYGSETKILVCSPLVMSAINAWAVDKMRLEPSETIYGVKVRRFLTGHGDFIIIKDWSLEDGIAGKNGFGGWAFAIDPENVELKYLSGYGVNRDVQVIEDASKDGSDRKIDQVLAEIGACWKHEKTHAKLYNVTAWS